MSPEQNNNDQQQPHLEENDQLEPSTIPEEELEYDSFSDELDPIGTPDIPQPEAINEDQIRIAALEEELVKTKDLMMRTVAEAENGRKRAIRGREDAAKFAVSSFSKDLLNVADNLRRALEAVPAELLEQTPQIKNLTDGIEATERELLRSFEKNGIKKTNPINEKFDPNFHEVMFEAPMLDKPRGTIIQVLEPGYTLHGRILRPARVGIAKNDGNTHPPSKETGQNIDTQA